MRYYIDFEASEAEQKIISVGCIREDGQEFYSLVNVDDPITPRIEEITGISQEEIDNAPEGKEVFSNLYDWLSQDELPEIMCYGDGDFDVLVDVRSSDIFSSMSDKINATVGSLKENIDKEANKYNADFETAKDIHPY